MDFSSLPGCAWSLREVATLPDRGKQEPVEYSLPGPGPLIHVVTPAGEPICSVSSSCCHRAADLKKHVKLETGLPISRQRLMLGNELADNVTLRGDSCEDAMVITLERLPPNAAEVYISSATTLRFIGIDSTGAVVAADRGQVFIARLADDEEFVLQVGEGPYVGSFLSALSGPPFSKSSALVLQAQPERWKLVPLRSLDEPQASSEAVVYGFMLATRTYAALGGLYCHEAEGDHYHLVQHAGVCCDRLDGFHVTRAAAEDESAIGLVAGIPSLRLDH